ncbi:MAG: acetylglutamate kinase ArgB [Idiomarinaceae bacterium HL-53]|nr:MAG: acetylglutamate kinase ArgB [Idiomarinaceae bacterium HL-53]
MAPKQLLALLSKLEAYRHDYHFVFVHGGGPQVESALALANLSSTKVDGQRLTSAAEMPLVIGALAGFASQQFLAILQQAKWSGCGISLSDAGGIPLQQPDLRIQVGTPDWSLLSHSKLAYQTLLETQLTAGMTPVVSSVGLSYANEFLNVNADFAAAAIAILLEAPLLLLSNVNGVLDAQGQVLETITTSEIPALLKAEYVTAGMRVKLAAAHAAVTHSRRNSAITSWQVPALVIAALQQGALKQKNSGTTIVI